MTVDARQRFSRANPCPICGGWKTQPQGRGLRCWGFLSDDGEWAHCTREEHAGSLSPGPDGAYAHRLHGSCRCGRQHGPDSFARARADFQRTHSTEDLARVLTAAAASKTKPDSGNGREPAFADRRLVTVSMADVEEREVPWAWRGWVSRAALCVVTGHPDVGKSYLTYAIAAAYTTGGVLPGDPTARQPERVLSLGHEDPLEFVVRPRLRQLGADPAMVTAITSVEVNGTPGFFNLRADLDLLEQELSRVRYGLVVISPLNAYLGDLDNHRDSAMRSVLNPLGALGERHDVAIIAIIHPTKGGGQGTLPLYRIQGSVANSAACRTAILVGKDEGADGEGSPRRHVVLLKNNLMPDEDKPSPLAFTLTKADGFRWAGASTASKEALLNGPAEAEGSEARTLIEQAMSALETVLNNGPVEAKAARREVHDATGASDRTIDTAKVRLGVEAHKVGFSPSRWEWSLPRRAHDSREGCRGAGPTSFEENLRPSEPTGGSRCPDGHRCSQPASGRWECCGQPEEES